MNIFYLDEDPVQAAMDHADRHVLKMILETAQLLSTSKAACGEPDARLYRPTHAHHPCGLWARASKSNYDWLYRLFAALLDEYRFRYGKTHAAARLLPLLADPPRVLPDAGFSPPPPVMPDAFVVSGDTVASYRNYYRFGKAHLHRWTKRGKPAWI